MSDLASKLDWRPAPPTEDISQVQLPPGATMRSFAAVAADGQTLRCLIVRRPDGQRALQLSVRSKVIAPDDHAPLASRALTLEEIWSAAAALMPSSVLAAILAVEPAQLCDVMLVEYARRTPPGNEALTSAA